MTGKDRDEDSGKYVETYPPEEFLKALEALGGSGTAREVAERVGSHKWTARSKLQDLADRGLVEKRLVGRTHLWSIADSD